jgi:fibronectin-binding autotransporter adhesin
MKNQNQPATSFRHSTERSRRFVGVSPAIHGLAAVPAVRPLAFINSRRRTILPLLTVAAVALTGSIASALDYSWDPGQTPGTPSGGPGAWDTSSLFWANGGVDFAWPNTSPSADGAIFGGTAGTVTIAASTAINVNKLTFNTAGYTIAAAAGGALNFSGTTPTVNNAVGSNATATNLTSPLTASDQLTLTGTNPVLSSSGRTDGSILKINNASNLTTLTGGIKLTSGVLETSTAGSLGNGTLTLNGGWLRPRANLVNDVVVTASSAIDMSFTTSTFTLGSLTIGAQTLTVVSGPSSTQNGNISFTGTTTLTGSATILNHASTNSGTGLTSPNATFSAVTVGDTVTTGTTTTFNLNSQTNTVGRTRQITVNGALSDNATDGTKKLALTVGGGNNGGNLTVNLNGDNTYTGNTAVSAGTLKLNDNADLKFVIGATGVNNQITGAGTVSLAGDFTFDLAVAAPEGSWTTVNNATLVETFTSTFTVNGFTDNADNTWSKMVGDSTYTFAESTGILTAVIPEPTSGAMVLGGLGMLLAWQNGRRRRNSAARGF